MALSFYNGGKSVISPTFGNTSFSSGIWVNGSIETSSINPDPERIGGHWEWSTHYSNSFLFKHASETLNEFQERSARSAHLPIFQPIVNTYVAGIFRTAPSRNDENIDAMWQSYHQDIDDNGTNIDSFISDSLTKGLVFGRCHCIVDATPTSYPINSLAEQQALGVRAYCNIITPLNLIDWEIDSKGRFLWVVIKELAPNNRLPGQETGKQEYQFRVWTPESWHLYRLLDKDWVVVNEGSHPCGQVPIATLWANKSKTMDCESPLASVCDNDRHIFNKLSELDALERNQAFSQLCIPQVGGEVASPVELGPARAFGYPAEGNAPSYISPDPNHAVGLFDRILDKIQSIRVSAGISRGKPENSIESRSASALSAEMSEKNNQMSIWAAATEEYDNQIHYLISKWEGKADYPIASYTRNYDLRSISQQINDLLQIKSTEILNEFSLKEIAKPIVEKVLKENAIPEERIKAIIDGF